MASTEVLYPGGAVTADADVLRVERIDGGLAVITDRTPFHPLDHSWPDQPGDQGVLAGIPVIDCLTGAVGPDGDLRVADDIPVRRGDPEWDWVVLHVLGDPTHPPQPGQSVRLEVAEDTRRSLSVAHTACHLAALALNEATAGFWRKDPARTDSLGNPDLDGLAITRSTIGPWQSVDDYRLGKSIRKKGLQTDELLAALPELADTVTERVRGWIRTGAEVTVNSPGDSTLAARRHWHVDLPEGPGDYPCGGTHVDSLGKLPMGTQITYTPTEDGFRATTLARITP